MNSAPEQSIVGQQIGDVEHVGELAEERRRGQHAVQPRDRRGKLPGIGDLNFLALVHGTERPPYLLRIIVGGKRARDGFGEIRMEKAVKTKVRKRSSASDLAAKFLLVEGVDHRDRPT